MKKKTKVLENSLLPPKNIESLTIPRLSCLIERLSKLQKYSNSENRSIT